MVATAEKALLPPPMASSSSAQHVVSTVIGSADFGMSAIFVPSFHLAHSSITFLKVAPIS
ncbi:hypothetical protein EYZ11_003592 [Aspergillus tanneri]|uniref:Uncharacterized protein n=1 Tax=Aspergillus tanneri TaxID=1220188 RepID=A0A4S3JTD0_9EURO|nr:hypothetical protein EYZ11_003592 [Aspergillus tanneri]